MVLGDKIAIMDQGKLVQIGRPEEVYLHPQNDFARDFLGISNQFTDMRGNHICCRPEELEFVDNGTVKGIVTVSYTHLDVYKRQVELDIK